MFWHENLIPSKDAVKKWMNHTVLRCVHLTVRCSEVWSGTWRNPALISRLTFSSQNQWFFSRRVYFGSIGKPFGGDQATSKPICVNFKRFRGFPVFSFWIMWIACIYIYICMYTDCIICYIIYRCILWIFACICNKFILYTHILHMCIKSLHIHIQSYMYIYTYILYKYHVCAPK